MREHVRPRSAVRLALPIALAVVTPLVMATPADALIVPLPMRVGVDTVPGGIVACGSGTAANAGTWLLRADGARYYDVIGADADHPEPEWVIAQSITRTSAAFDECLTVSFDRADAGHVDFTLSYAGTGPDFVGVLAGSGSWVGNFADGTGTQIGGGP